MLSQYLDVVAGKNYVVSFKVYGTASADNSAFFLRLGSPSATTVDTSAIYHTLASLADVSDTWTRQIRFNMNTKKGAWQTVTVPFAAAKTTGISLAIYNYRASAGNYYFDDFIVWEAKETSNDGYIVNGDFENGTLNGLTPYQSTNPCIQAAKDGNFGLHLVGNGGWGSVGLWNINTLEAGATYLLSYDYKTASVGVNWTLWQDSTSSGVKYAGGWISKTAWTHVEAEFVANTANAVLNFNGGGNGNAENVYLDNLKITLVKPAHTHDYVGTVTKEPTCTEAGEMTYSCTCGEGTYTEVIPASHTFDYECSTSCSVCWEENLREASHSLIHVEDKEPVDCATPGNIEYWYCEYCGENWTDAEGINGIAPWMITITADCVRPEGIADCATVTCETCGKEIYGYGEHDVVACQGGTCGKCGETVEGYGHQNYDGPACLPGNCYYCGEAMEPVEHENGAWAPCLEGECSYGCGKTYPATAEHVDDDANDYCDTCWNHLNHDVDPCVGGECSICWTYVEGAHTYDHAFDTDCNKCGEVRAVVGPISYIAKSVSEDVNGYAVLFDAAVEGIVVKAGTFVQADFTNATYNGYKLLGLGVKASNGVSETTIEGLRMYDLEDGNAKFAFRIVNIPADKLDVEITMTPYYVVEIDGVATTLYGEAVVGSYAEVAG